MNLSWYLHRLRVMSPAEIGGRTAGVFKHSCWRRKFGVPRSGRPCAPFKTDVHLRPAVKPDNTLAEKALLDEAEACLRHEWRFFGNAVPAEKTIDWSRDPLTGVVAPQTFSFSINHRNKSLAGDVKYTWEKNRLHQITVLAAAFALTRKSSYSTEVVGQLKSWIGSNPLLRGINWTHPLEAAIRTIAFVWSERLLRGAAQHDFFTTAAFLESMDDHLWFIDASYSTGSSANNHLIGEAAGAFIGACALGPSPASKRRRARSKAILEREIVRQTFPDGINREQGFEYHLFTTEFFLLALYEARRCGDDFSQRYSTTLRAMIEAIVRLRDPARNLPAYGDGDDGRAILLDARVADRTAWILPLGASLTKAAPGPLPSSPLPLTLGFLGPDVKTNDRVLPYAGNDAFSDAGLYVMRSRPVHGCAIQVIADAGELGFGPLAAHGHADALSFTLSIGGTPLFVDSGTYTYYGDPAARAYFRGTPAHNTVCVDGCDQSVQAGPFLWAEKASATVEQWTADKNTSRLVASHDGYRKKGVLHRRSFSLSGATLTIEDILEGNGPHRIEIFFHCAPSCNVTADAGALRVENKDCCAVVTLPPLLSVSVEHGGKYGWHSPLFGVREPAPVILASAKIPLPVAFTTTIEMIHER